MFKVWVEYSTVLLERTSMDYMFLVDHRKKFGTLKAAREHVQLINGRSDVRVVKRPTITFDSARE